MEKTHVMSDDKAQELKQALKDDILKGYYKLFYKVEMILISVLLSIDNKIPFTYEQDCTLRANGYTKGIVADWYYPKCKDWKIVR